MGDSFDVDAFLDSLGPMTADQRRLVDDAMKRVAVLACGHEPEFLRETARYLASLVLVGNVAVIDETAWATLRLIHAKHVAASGASDS